VVSYQTFDLVMNEALAYESLDMEEEHSEISCAKGKNANQLTG